AQPVSSMDPFKLPITTPPAPEAAALGRYGEFPVTLATGTPEITIPLYEIKSGSLSIPLSLSYHASGIRVNDQASRVGLGWTLQGVGLITRVVKGNPDESGYCIFGIPLESQQDSNFYCFQNMQLLINNKDGEPDIFYYNFPGKSGRFVFTNKTATGAAPVAVPVPYDLIRINVSQTDYWAQWTIVDDKGITYIFGKSIDGSSAREATSAMNSGGKAYPLSGSSFYSSWYLTNIISADKADTITLTYYSNPGVPSPCYISTSMRDDISEPTTAQPHTVNYNLSTSDGLVDEVRIKDILFRNGKVSFDYNANRRPDITGDTSMIGLRVYQYINGTYQQIKKYSFFQSYFSCRNIASPPQYICDMGGDITKRLRLDSVKQIDLSGNQLPGYVFSYSPVQLPIFESYAQDYWGFYNGALNTKLLIYDEPLPGANQNPPSMTYGANRNVQPDSMMAGMLQKITFPTGGSSVFTYEPNKIDSVITGGIRIKKIVSYDGNGGGVTKVYKYSNERSISNLYDGRISTLGSYWQIPYRNLEALNPSTQQTVYRSYVTYLESFPLPIGSASGSAVCYGQVEEYYDSLNGQGGKTVYTYSTTQDQSPSIIPQNIVSNEWDRGRLLTESKYKSNGSGGFVRLSTHVNNYTFNQKSYEIKSLVSRAGTLYQDGPAGILPAHPCTDFDARNVILSVFNPIVIGNEYITQTIDTVYDQNGSNPQITTVNYFFDDTANILPTRTETVDSRGTLVRTYQWHPLEKHKIDSALTLSASASVAIDSLLSKNILTPVIDQEAYYGGTRQTRVRTNYKVFSSNLIKPSMVQGQFGPNPIEDRLQFIRYDSHGNLISGAKVGDVISTHIMDYKKEFVVASIAGADSGSVAYTSFESDGKGDWSYTGTPVTDATSPTGTMCYPLAPGISKSGLASSTTYIVSFWSKGGSASVSGSVSSRSIWTLNGWTYYEYTVSGVTSTSIYGSGYIDEVRLYPSTAQMTTYTYSPLVGITASSDTNGRLTTYQYDSFGRLV